MHRDPRVLMVPDQIDPAFSEHRDGTLECEESQGQALYTISSAGQVLGFVAIDSTVRGRARGGLRMLPDVSEEEIRAAARTMTLKYGFLGLPQGGAKAGVRGDGEGPVAAKCERLLQFARSAEPLLRTRAYVPDADLGTRADDIRGMMQTVGITVGPREWRSNRSGFYTAISCLASAEAALRHRRASLAGSRVAIEGFGSVGSSLAKLLHARGGIVVAISTSRGAVYRPGGLDIPQLLQLSSEAGSRVVERHRGADRLPREALLELPVDLVCPCARHHSIHGGNAVRVAAPVVCAGANNPLSDAAERVLLERGVLIVPDFVSNCGGVLGGTLEFAGVSSDRTVALIERALVRAVESLLEEAERRRQPLRAVAEALALDRHQRIRHETERPGLGGWAVSTGLAAYRRGWVPQALVSRLAPGYVERRLWP